MPLGRNLYPPTRDTRIAGHDRDIHRLQRRLYSPGPWQYATPTDPAPTPSDISDSSEGAPFTGTWHNITLPDGSWSPLRWRFSHDGRVELVGAIDGGDLGSVCVTLPSAYRPLEDVLATVSSTDGTRVMTVKIDASNGDVTVVGIPASVPGDGSVTDAKLTDTGVTAGSYGDGAHVATFTVNSKGRLTAAGQAAIAIAESAVTGLVSDLAALSSAIAAKISASIVTTKGDLLVATASATLARLGVGANGNVLTADSAQATGMKWAAPSGGGGGGDTLHTVSSSGSSLTVDFSTADVWDITLSANCTISLTGFTSGAPDFITAILHQDGAGSRTVTWPTITWIGNGDTPPTLQSAPGAVDSVVLFSFDGGTTVYGVAQTSASGLQSGTSFPGSPSDGQLFYRSDRRIMYEYVSSISKWLSLDRKYITFTGSRVLNNSGTTGVYGWLPLGEDLYIDSWVSLAHLGLTNTGSAFYTLSLQEGAPNTTATTLASFTTAADTAGTNTVHNVSVGSVVSATSFPALSISLAKTGAPSVADFVSYIVARTVG